MISSSCHVRAEGDEDGSPSCDDSGEVGLTAIARGVVGVDTNEFALDMSIPRPRFEVARLGEVIGVRCGGVDGLLGRPVGFGASAFCRVGDTSGDEGSRRYAPGVSATSSSLRRRFVGEPSGVCMSSSPSRFMRFLAAARLEGL